MKIAIICLTVLIAYVSAETCQHTDQCNLETCVGDGWAVNCHRGTCTCDNKDHTGGNCTTQMDCGSLHCGGFQMIQAHCIDGSCRCSLRPGK